MMERTEMATEGGPAVAELSLPEANGFHRKHLG